MENKYKDLIKVSSYAKENNLSVQWVYELAKKGELKMIIIDNMKFIKRGIKILANTRI